MRNAKGQISLFFATTLFVLMTFLAFVINIGIFVKVKINLQNATDAAAFAGASVQARQLTNIAYLNWEMRNVHKEWMFKYYVLGNLNISDIENGPPGDQVSFLMSTYRGATNASRDRYNFPSACIDFAGSGVTALCKNYVIPGLPRFESISNGALDQTTNTMLDTLNAEKAKDCSYRSQVNFLTTSLWAYNVVTDDSSTNSLQALAPEIGAKQPGAFPKAFELAMRMRSLEKQVNAEPQTQGVCLEINDRNSEYCSTSINNIIGSNLPKDERVNKALFSAIRNLGGSDGNEAEELRASFSLRELPPTAFTEDSETSTSNLLIPSGVSRTKHYLDLKLMTLNYATFYTTFATTDENINVNGSNLQTESACASTKTGLPIPGYPLGFIKNPDVVTYYAVEGTAKFVGMFNPFENPEEGIKIKAYSAAKPFGGRVGPMLFDMTDHSVVKARSADGTDKKISSAFATGLDSSKFVTRFGDPLASGQYSAGAPLPIDISGGSSFWQSDANAPLGGWPSGDESVVFSIPNLIYDYPDDNPNDTSSYLSSEDIDVIDATNESQVLKTGLFNAKIMSKFRANLPSIGSPTGIEVDEIRNSFYRVRAPTRWEANNYLIPTTEEVNRALGLDSFGFVSLGKEVLNLGSAKVHNMQIYAPLIGPDAILKSAGELESVLNRYLDIQEGAVKKYLHSLNVAAASIYRNNTSGGTGSQTAVDAAKIISDIPNENYAAGSETADTALPTCASIAGQFMYFYYGPNATSSLLRSADGCVPANIDPRDAYLSGMLQKYFASSSLNKTFHDTTLTMRSDPETNAFLMTAYSPGPLNDANNQGSWVNRVRNNTAENMKRNFYSTKFVTLRSLSSKGSASFREQGAGLPIHSEGNASARSSGGYTAQKDFANPINLQELNLSLDVINH